MMKSKGNICKRVFSSQVSGRGIKAAFEIPESCFGETDNAMMEMRVIINNLLKMIANHLRPYETIHETIKSLWQILNSNDNVVRELSQMVCDYGLVEILCDVLLEDIFAVSDDEEVSLMKCPQSRIKDAQILLMVISRSTAESPTSFHHLRWNPRLMKILLSFLKTSDPLSNLALTILEVALLGTDQPPIYLAHLHQFRSFLEHLTFTQHEYPFFHLLSSFMSDSDCIASSNSTLEKHDHWLAMRSSHTVEENHRFILDIPNFMEGMCGSISQCPSTTSPLPPQMEVNAVSDLLNVLQLLAMHQNIYMDVDDDLAGNFPSSLHHLQFHTSKFFIADIFHIISLFLLGKFREEVQQRLANCEFFASLQEPAEKIVWMKSPQQIVWDQLRDVDDFSVDTIVQIQFLRLIHAIADNHSNRYFLLTASELAHLKQLAGAKKLELPRPLLEFERHHTAPSGEKGLLSLIVDKLKLEDGKSLIRFWITRAMEAFLRGETCAVHQLFLINKNVIENTVGVLLNWGPKHEMVLQGSFDFLSTIMRNNCEAFRRCEASIDCTAKFVQLVKEVDDRLIDSNMFLRCIVLTNNYMKHKRGQFGASRLLDWFIDVEVLLNIVAKLIRLLSVPTLSQENVSCLNTTILVLYLAGEEKQLPRYLSPLSEFNDGQFLIGNLKNLLQFWRSHYTLPSKKIDRKNLEVSTGISFVKWCEFVELLLGTDPSSLYSLRHYLHEKKASTPSLFRRSRIP